MSKNKLPTEWKNRVRESGQVRDCADLCRTARVYKGRHRTSVKWFAGHYDLQNGHWIQIGVAGPFSTMKAAKDYADMVYH